MPGLASVPPETRRSFISIARLVIDQLGPVAAREEAERRPGFRASRGSTPKDGS
jgi:hypothetical protein